MKTQLKTLGFASGAVIWIALALVGCNGLTTTDAARTGLGYSLAAYSGYQGLLLQYSKLPYCEEPAVAPCRDRKLYKKLYDADAEYSADTLEGIYDDLEKVSHRVLKSEVNDQAAAEALAAIARQEDLNGRIRRNVMDTRRAVSFMMRSRMLNAEQFEEARQILRDIDSLDSHSTFLFDKINFLMDAVVGFININQNQRVSKLTKLSIIFMPINIVAGIGGMSEFSMMTSGIPWPVAYGAFTLGMGVVGWLTYLALRQAERREASGKLDEARAMMMSTSSSTSNR